MLSILDQQLADQQRAAGSEAAVRQEQAQEFKPEAAEFEIVLGRPQIACWLFVGLTAIAVCSSLAYLAGKSASPKKAPAAVVEVPPPSSVSAQPVAMPSASITVPPKTGLPTLLKTAPAPAPFLFAEPQTGKVYIQVGAVQKGMAIVLAEGLRSHGFDAFVAPGPSKEIFRVLIGPLPDPDTFRQAKAAADAIDLANFERKYQK